MKRLIIPLIVVMIVVSTILPAFAQKPDNPGSQGNHGGNSKEQPVFTDMAGHWAEALVGKMAEKGIAKGAYGKFQPNKPITRSELASLLHRVLNIQLKYDETPDITEIYDDVTNDKWYSTALYDLEALNIIDVKGHFIPNKPVSREEMAHFIMNAYRYATGDTDEEIEANLDEYADENEISIQYTGDMAYAVGLGLIQGDGKKHLSPHSSTKRVEAIVILSRLMDLLEIEPAENAQVEVQSDYKFIGDTFKMYLNITNKSEHTVTINHSSGQKFDFELLDADRKVIYRWSEDKHFTQALTETVIESGDDVRFSDTLDVDAYEDIIHDAKYLKAYIKGTSEQFRINARGYETKITRKSVNTADIDVKPSLQVKSGKYIMKLAITNNSDENVTLELSSQKYDFVLLDENDEELYRWSDGKAFTLMVLLQNITPGETVVFSEQLDVKAYRSIIQDAKYMKAFIIGSSEDFEIDSSGYTLTLD